jgi:hypothetical protein
MRQNGTEILIKCTDLTRQPDILFFAKSIFCESFTGQGKHAELDFYSVSSLKQQSAGRHVAPLGHIVLTL